MGFASNLLTDFKDGVLATMEFSVVATYAIGHSLSLKSFLESVTAVETFSTLDKICFRIRQMFSSFLYTHKEYLIVVVNAPRLDLFHWRNDSSVLPLHLLWSTTVTPLTVEAGTPAAIATSFIDCKVAASSDLDLDEKRSSVVA